MRPINLSTVYRGLARDARPAAAAAHGALRVESWWEFDSATPDAADVDRFVAAIRDAGVELIALNSHGGDRDAGERGLASLPDRESEFRASIDSLVRVADALGTRLFNVTAGNLDAERWRASEQFETAARRYAWAAARVAPIGGTILVESLAAEENPDYPFRTGVDVAAFLDDAASSVPNIAVLVDTYHLAANGIDLPSTIHTLGDRIGHVQLADAPGRGAPGTGSIDFDAVHAALDDVGYAGERALEYLA